MPQLFVESSSAVFDDPAHFPWTMGFFATYRTEGSAYAKYILQSKPGARIAVLYANDDAGKEYLAGVRGGLGDKASAMIVKEVSYQASDAALDSQIIWMSIYNAQASLRDQNKVAGYERAQALVEVLRKCGDDLTRANVMKQAANLDLELGMLRPGIRIKTTPTDYQPIKQLFLIRFNGKGWVPIGPVMGD